MRDAEAGFTLIEAVIAAALFAFVALGALEAMRGLLHGARQLGARHVAYETLERLASQLRADARSATAIWTPAAPPGAGYDACLQLDFFTVDRSGPRFWAYRRFPNHASGDPVPADALERVDAAAPLPACSAPGAGTTVLRGLRTFELDATAPPFTTTGKAALLAHADWYTGTADSPFLAPGFSDTAATPLGALDAGGTPIAGGNALVEVRLENADASRVVDLVAGVVPTGFVAQLTYTCDARCAVGHAGTSPQTLTDCGMTWEPGWIAAGPDGAWAPPGGARLTWAPADYLWAGYFHFVYDDPIFATGDRLEKYLVATNDGPGGTPTAAQPPTASASGAAAESWYQAGRAALTAASRAALTAEHATCAGMQGRAAGDFTQNG